MDAPPIVGVVIPAYNAERWIERTLRSALRQTYRALEILVVDDGSTDATGALAGSFAAADARVRVISVSNGGVASARNLGIEQSTAPFIAFLDADDLWHPTKIERQLASLTAASGEGIAATYALHRVIDSEDRVVAREHGFICNGYALAQLLYAKFIGNGSSLLVRREAAVAVGGFDPTWAKRGLGGCEDLDFELKLVAKYPISAVPHFLVGYRVYPGNMSSDRLRMGRAIVATVERHLCEHAELPSWAAMKARAAANEYALCQFLAERRWDMVALNAAKLFRNDAHRALDFIGGLTARKVRKSFDRGRASQTQSYELPVFDDVRPEPKSDGIFAIDEARRDLMNMARLAQLDAALAKQLGFA
jgi:glycosyltransferase involved in cell wall biosynthesis